MSLACWSKMSKIQVQISVYMHSASFKHVTVLVGGHIIIFKGLCLALFCPLTIYYTPPSLYSKQ